MVDAVPSTQSQTRSERAGSFSPCRTDRMGPELHSKRSGQIGCCAISLEKYLMADAEYLTILDWLARNTIAGKRGSTPEEAPKIFERLGIDAELWSQMVKDFGRRWTSCDAKHRS